MYTIAELAAIISVLSAKVEAQEETLKDQGLRIEQFEREKAIKEAIKSPYGWEVLYNTITRKVYYYRVSTNTTVFSSAEALEIMRIEEVVLLAQNKEIADKEAARAAAREVTKAANTAKAASHPPKPPNQKCQTNQAIDSKRSKAETARKTDMGTKLSDIRGDYEVKKKLDEIIKHPVASWMEMKYALGLVFLIATAHKCKRPESNKRICDILTFFFNGSKQSEQWKKGLLKVEDIVSCKSDPYVPGKHMDVFGNKTFYDECWKLLLRSKTEVIRGSKGGWSTSNVQLFEDDYFYNPP
jgi:hypothetical protein